MSCGEGHGCSPRKYKKTKTKVWQSHVLGGSKMEWWDFGFWSSERAGLTWARQPPCRRKPGLPGTSGSLPIARAYGWQRWEVLPSDSATGLLRLMAAPTAQTHPEQQERGWSFPHPERSSRSQLLNLHPACHHAGCSPCPQGAWTSLIMQ